MINDEDRREVAEKLRASIPGDGVMRRGDKGWSLLYRTIFGHYMGHQSAGRTYSEVAGRLADLIEPSESGQNRDTNRDTVPKESPAVQKAPECDRDALLALADEIDSDADNGMGGTFLRYYALCIREALGVER